MKVERGVRRAPVSFTELTLPSLIAVAILALAGCSAGAGSGGSGNNITVAITNKVTTVQAGTAAISFSATVQNDTSNKGVTWSLTASGSNCCSHLRRSVRSDYVECDLHAARFRRRFAEQSAHAYGHFGGEDEQIRHGHIHGQSRTGCNDHEQSQHRKFGD